ncbi:hypothetical protein PSHT_06133 [Puccinia striiformis]|uniref:Uncharacterized protein n=1 Tax=Puccinia striiformis TaxID=27350 RepID=A0A2S4W8S9_9BASI|nr:hypothetical protein PSHT_06133 [Puccinia striiformis]
MFALGFSRPSLSSVGAWEHPVIESLGTASLIILPFCDNVLAVLLISRGGLQGVDHLAPSSSIVTDHPKGINQEERILQLDSAARKAEIKLLKDTSTQIKHRIGALGGRDPISRKVQSQLEDLRLALKRLILDRVLQLSGLGPSMTSFNAVRHRGQAGSSTHRTALQLSKLSSWTNNLWSWLKSLSHSIAARHNREVTYVEIPDDILFILKDIMSNDRMKNWTSLENTLFGFEAQADRLRENEANFKRNILEIFYTLGDCISRNQLLPPDFIQNMEIFKTPATFKMIKYHQREEVRISSTSIGPSKDHGMSWNFYNIRRNFIKSTFLEEADRLSSAIINEPQIDHFRSTLENLLIFDMIRTVIKVLQKPAKTYIKASRRVEFLVVYYLSDFLNEHYGALFEAVLRESRYRSFFRERMDYLTAYLKFFRNRFEDPNHADQKQDKSFLRLTENFAIKNSPLTKWIARVTIITFKHNLVLDGIDRSPHFTLWMSAKCYCCARPFRTCPPSCSAAKPSQIT